MSASKVYFTNFRATFTENLLQKLARLVKKAGMLEQIDFKNQYTAINPATWPIFARIIPKLSST
jgi:uncharacterized Fe-S center protein